MNCAEQCVESSLKVCNKTVGSKNHHSVHARYLSFLRLDAKPVHARTKIRMTTIVVVRVRCSFLEKQARPQGVKVVFTKNKLS